MRLLIVRHGPAGDREEFASTGQPDDLRPLTTEGAGEFAKVARALRRLVERIDALAASPLVRARQTADILAAAYDVPVVGTDALRPDAPYPKFVRWAARSAREETTAIVGHEPHLSGLAAWLIGSGDAHLTLKKGGVALVEFEGLPRSGTGTLAWLLEPRVMRRLRRK
jgi:phosphohistidine phosphatase